MAVIFPNEQMQSSSVWNFDIAHELGHMVMHRGIRTGNIETEREADRLLARSLCQTGRLGVSFEDCHFRGTMFLD
jgi:Zn-dependent peptidase ImmA (M78 family)